MAAWSDEITGGVARNVLDGGDADDVIRGGGGDDVVGDSPTAQGGLSNLLEGGTGADDFIGAGTASYADHPASVTADFDGADDIDGGANRDALDGGPGADDLKGRLGSNTVDYSAHTTGVTATIDADADDGSSEDESGARRDKIDVDVENLTGGPAADPLTGDEDPNSLVGQNGADTLPAVRAPTVCTGARWSRSSAILTPAATSSGAQGDNDTDGDGRGDATDPKPLRR